MRPPFYEFIEIHGFDLESLLGKLKNCQLGNSPYVFEILGAEDYEAQKIYDNLEAKLIKEEVNCHFPYPIYIVTKNNINVAGISVFSSKKHLPRFFNVIKGSMGPKESALLKKIDIKKEKLMMLDINESIEKSNSLKKENKSLFELLNYESYLLEFQKALENRNEQKKE